MTVYQIVYTLNSPEQNYEDLHDKIESLGDTAHILDACWLLESDHDSASDVRDAIKPALSYNDELLVTQISSGWSWGTNFSTDETDWLSDKL